MKFIINLFKNKKIDFAEKIIDYEYRFSNNYLYDKKLLSFLKSNSTNERLNYVLNSCSKENPNKKEQFLLALAYNRMPIKYNEFAIKYLNLYLSDNNYYLKTFKNNTNKNDLIDYQTHLFYSMLAIKYDNDLMFDEALKCIDIAINTNKELWNTWEKPFATYAEILYHNQNINGAISILESAMRETTDIHKKLDYNDLINKYTRYSINGVKYKPRNIKRPRIDTVSNVLYDLTTGEIIEK